MQKDIIIKDYFGYVKTDDMILIEAAIQKIIYSNQVRPWRRGDAVAVILKTVANDEKLISKCIEALK
jgi:hypothetical protein